MLARRHRSGAACADRRNRASWNAFGDAPGARRDRGGGTEATEAPESARRPASTRGEAARQCPRRPRAPPSQSLHHRRWVSPAARRIAASLGVDVDTVTGTGPQGAVTINDVEHAAASANEADEPSPPRRTAHPRCESPSRRR